MACALAISNRHAATFQLLFLALSVCLAFCYCIGVARRCLTGLEADQLPAHVINSFHMHSCNLQLCMPLIMRSFRLCHRWFDEYIPSLMVSRLWTCLHRICMTCTCLSPLLQLHPCSASRRDCFPCISPACLCATCAAANLFFAEHESIDYLSSCGATAFSGFALLVRTRGLICFSLSAKEMVLGIAAPCDCYQDMLN